jgi:hypothetical protein
VATAALATSGHHTTIGLLPSSATVLSTPARAPPTFLELGRPAGAAGPVYGSEDRGEWVLVAELKTSHAVQMAPVMAM